MDRETLESIIAWGDQTFGPCTQDRAIERAGEEWFEMIADGADVSIEAADVIICLLRVPGVLDAINRKMAINRQRQWNVRPDGTGYHVKPTQPKDGNDERQTLRRTHELRMQAHWGKNYDTTNDPWPETDADWRQTPHGAPWDTNVHMARWTLSLAKKLQEEKLI